jgi:hypothetical protein
VKDGANERVFEFPAYIRSYLLPAAIVGGAMISFEIAPPPSNLALAICLTVAATVELIHFSGLRYRVAVSGDGMRYLPYRAAPIYLRWDEVASLELREEILRGQLVVSDAARLRTMALDYRLDRFQDLLSIVVDRAAGCDPHPPLPSTFHSSYLDQTVVVLVFFVCTVLSIHFVGGGQSIIATAFGLFALLSVGTLAAFPHSLTVSTDSVELGYLGRRRVIALASVKGVRFGVQRGNRGAMWTVVWLDTSEGRPLKLTGFNKDSLAVYYALRDAWRPLKDS